VASDIVSAPYRAGHGGQQLSLGPLRAFYAVAAVLGVIAGILLFVGAAETDRFFSWTIEPPLTAAFLGAAYWAAAVLLSWAAQRSTWPEARTALPPVFAIAVLLLVATLVHLDKFDLDSLFGWFWLVVYVIVPPLLVWMIWRARPDRPEAPGGGRPLPGWLRWALGAQAVVMLGFGVALFAAPLDVASAWPWTLTELTGRAIGAFLCGFGLAAAFAVREDDFDRLRGSALAYATLGALELLALAIHADDVTASGAGTALYAAVWASVLATGLYGSLVPASARRAAS
jgi:hypothetical protein